MSVTVGTVNINLAAGTAEFISDLGKAKEFAARTAQDIQKSFQRVATAAQVLLAGEVTHSLLEMANNSIEAMARMGHMAESVGTTVQTMSQLGVAARLSNVPVEDVGKGLEKLASSALAAETGNRKLSNVFAKLGVDVKNGNGGLRDTGSILLDLAKSLEKYKDDSGKTGVLREIFGKAGGQMNPMLHEMAQHWTEVTDASSKFGLTLSTQTAAAAEKTVQGLTRLKLAGEGAFQSLMASALPALEQLTSRMQAWAQQTNLAGKIQAFGPELVHGVEMLGNAMQFCVDHATALKRVLEGLAGLKLVQLFAPMALQLSAAQSPLMLIVEGFGKFLQHAAGLGSLTRELGIVWTSMREGTAVLRTMYETESLIPVALRGIGMALNSTLGILGGMTAGVGLLAWGFMRASDDADRLSGGAATFQDKWNAALGNISAGLQSFGLHIRAVMDALSIVGAWKGYREWQQGASIDNSRQSMAEVAAASAKARQAQMHPSAGYQGASDAADKFMHQFVAAHKRALANIEVADFQNELRKKVSEMYSLPDREKQAIIARETDFFTKAQRENKPSLGTAGLGTEQTAADLLKGRLAMIEEQTRAQTALGGAVGKYGDALIRVQALNEADKTITELNIELKKKGLGVLSASGEQQIRNAELAKAAAQTEYEFSKAIEEATHSSVLQADSSLMMAGATMQGEGAMRRAEASARIMGITYGWSEEQTAKYAKQLGTLYDALIKASEAQETASLQKQTFSTDLQVASQQKLNAAILQGKIAEDAVNDSLKIGELMRQRGQASTPELKAAYDMQIDSESKLLSLKREEATLTAARSLLGPAAQYAEANQALELQVEALRAAQGGILTYDQQLMIAAQEQVNFQTNIKNTVDMLLKQNSIGAGAQAFFTEYVNEAKTAAQQVSDFFKQAFTGIEDTLANGLMKGKFAKGFQDYFNGLASSLLKNTMHAGISGLMGAFGLGGGAAAADGKSQGTALWVRIAGALPGLGGLFGGGNSNSGIGAAIQAPGSAGMWNSFNMLGGQGAAASDTLAGASGAGGIFQKLFKGILGGLFGGFFAGGGAIDAGKFGIAGEGGHPEIVTGPAHVYNARQARDLLGSGGGIHQYIDARGADATETAMRVQRASEITHRQSVQTSVTALHEMMRRRPRSAMGRG